MAVLGGVRFLMSEVPLYTEHLNVFDEELRLTEAELGFSDLEIPYASRRSYSPVLARTVLFARCAALKARCPPRQTARVECLKSKSGTSVNLRNSGERKRRRSRSRSG
jgi:hypothetical protein